MRYQRVTSFIPEELEISALIVTDVGIQSDLARTLLEVVMFLIAGGTGLEASGGVDIALIVSLPTQAGKATIQIKTIVNRTQIFMSGHQ